MSDTQFQQKINDAGAAFHPTSWTLILNAGEGSEASLAEFCRAYWHPLYAYARRSGKNSADAQDLSQGFFAHLLRKETLQQAEPGRGRFRNYLLILFKRYMLNEWKRDNAQRRGGDLIKVDYEKAEFSLEEQTDLSPDEAYQRAWALVILDQTMAELEQRFSDRGEADKFAIMKSFLDGKAESTLREGADQVGMTENAFTVAVHRLRKDFAKLLRRHVAATLENPDEVQDELQQLSVLLRG